MPRIIDRSGNLSQLISPRRDIDRPIYNWHSFKHSYSKELVDFTISEFDLKKGAWIMDPFSGGGTTLLACKQAGINAHGFDILPFSVFLSNTKTNDYNVEELKNNLSNFSNINGVKINGYKLPDIPILQKAFSSDVKHELLKIRSKVELIEDIKVKDLFKLAFLSILESVSNTSKAGGFLRIIQRNIKSEEIEGIFIDKIQKMISDVEVFYQDRDNINCSIKTVLGDAREIRTDQKYDAVITSPPYPNRHDYTRIYALEMVFGFVNNNDELKSIRYETLRSHVEARKKIEAIGYKVPSMLTKLIMRVEKNGVNNPQVINMLKGYFEDMYLVLAEIRKHLKNNGKVALVVSNVRFAGINIPVDEILSDIGKQVGLKPDGIWLARYRGNSSQQMKTYNRIPSRESIIIWQNK